MKSALGSQTRLVALVALIAIAAAAGGYFFLFRGEAAPAAAQPLPKLPPRQPTHRTSVPAAPVRTPAAEQAPTGLPEALDRALRRHAVVVVSLYASDVPVDRLARAQSSAGARDAGAGFVSVNVLDRKQSEAIALQTGIVAAPSVLVFRRPNRLVSHFDGFVDRVAVAQAAVDARP